MHYKTPKHIAAFDKAATLDDFLKESGAGEIEPQKELSIKSHNDLDQLTNIFPLSF